MAAPLFIAWNADTSALTGPPAVTATSATSGTVKTILQIKPCANKTGTVFATVTTIGSGIRAYNDATGPASLASAGTAATGFNASAEGTVTASRLFGYNYDNSLYFKQQFPLGREPEVNAASALRIRATPTTSVAVNMWCYVIWEE